MVMLRSKGKRISNYPSLLFSFLLTLGLLPTMQHADSFPLLAAPNHIAAPAEQAINPAPADQDPADGVDDADEEAERAVTLLAHGQKDRLDVELEEYAGHTALADLGRVRRSGVLVGEDCVRRGGAERGVLRGERG